ncbi:hypothetical protein TELCIR_17241 [Teladorsagia circumcincta]|uniref:Uncharacterized protein n=1 Tax=Teladorsagia circumcincta TaxID=45464 RepID=A0A2G9TTA3_TELCI|nr:hypothetical protein TELCIR_17241 [Teladorsagia circumcincta]
MVLQATMVLLEMTAHQVVLEEVAEEGEESFALIVPLALQECQDDQDQRDHQDHLGQLECQPQQYNLALLDRQDHPDHQEWTESLVHLEIPADLGRLYKVEEVEEEQWDLLVPQDHLDRREHREHQEMLLLDHLALQVILECLVGQANLDHLVLQALQVGPVKREHVDIARFQDLHRDINMESYSHGSYVASREKFSS